MESHQRRRGGCADGRLTRAGRANPLGRRVGCRDKTTIAAAVLLAGEAEALTRKAVELALEGDPVDLQSTDLIRGRVAAVHRTNPAAGARTCGQVRLDADRECAHGTSRWAECP